MTGTVHRTRNGICSLIAPCPNLFLRCRADRREASAPETNRKNSSGSGTRRGSAWSAQRRSRPIHATTEPADPPMPGKRFPRNEAVRRFSRTGGMLSDRHGANLLKISVNLYKEYTPLKSRELEELPRFGVMSWQPS